MNSFIWALLIVTYGANVTYSEFPGKASCEQARSLLLYGQTVEEKAESDAKYEEEQKRQTKQYKHDHPECVQNSSDTAATLSQSCYVIMFGTTATTTGLNNSNDPKYARCVLVPKEQSQ